MARKRKPVNGELVVEAQGGKKSSAHSFRSKLEDFQYNLRRDMRSTDIEEGLNLALWRLKERGYVCPRIYKREGNLCDLVRSLDLGTNITEARFDIESSMLRELFVLGYRGYHDIDVFSTPNLTLQENDPLNHIDKKYTGIITIRYEAKSEILKRTIEGAITLNYDPLQKRITEKEIRLLDQVGWRIADTVARLLELKHVTRLNEQLTAANRRLERQIKIDGPTGLYNKKKFHEDLEIIIERVNCRKINAAYLVSMDLDHFKQLNDVYGHAEGDKVLAGFGKYLLQHAPNNGSNNVGYRIGGEEMAIVITLPKKKDVILEEQEIIPFLKAFHQGVHQLYVPEEKGSPLTVSARVLVALPEQFKDGEAWYDSADLLLYEAKRTGRDKVVFLGINRDKIYF